MAETLIGPKIFTGSRLLPAGTALTIADGRIAAIGDKGQGGRPVTLDGGLLAPGFIDLQVNGGGGVLFNDDPSPDAIARIVAAHRRFGTTGLLVTLISDDDATTAAALDTVEAAMAGKMPGLLGLHLEGPFLDGARRGVHPARHLRDPDEALLARLTTARVGRLMVTLSPNRVAPQTIARLAAAGVIVALGHTEADYDTAMAAFRAGAAGVTHLYNAMSPLQSRAPGMVGAALDCDDAWCGLIADGVHVHPSALRLAVRAKPPGRALLVTDAVSPVGAAAEPFDLLGERVTVTDGTCRTADGRLAGSTLDMATGVANLVRLVGLPLEEALRMASLYPARALGLDDQRGHLAPGAIADLVWLDDDLSVRDTWVADGAY